MLETFTDEELWDELKTRYTTSILVYEKNCKGKPGQYLCNNAIWSGSHATVLGLLKYGQRFVEVVIDQGFYEMMHQDDRE